MVANFMNDPTAVALREKMVWDELFKRFPPSTPQTSSDRGPSIKMVPSGTRVYLLDPKPDDLKVEDIAFHLAGIYRYTGGSRISVAQHCVNASNFAKRHYTGISSSKHLPAKMLVHDSPESVYGDVSSPLKRLLPDYKRLEQIGTAAFEERFELFWSQDAIVKEIDQRTMLTERPVVFGEEDHADEEWYFNRDLEPFKTEGDDLEPWTPEEAEARWLESFHNLLPWVEF